ncbi:hypothetical protein [Devosia sp.]|uniref:DUF6968 family protein n=1 Tax=Devosia sp. TaxID=1871048 RepID=UPI001ACC2C04|nr:hypothetical protein [Devosia sp.]MBN9336214.1 hypothetical protein [Devosia sp.]
MIIAAPVLSVEYEGQIRLVGIFLFLPEQLGKSWDCRYEIDWPEGKVTSFAGGNDAIAALFGAIEKVGMELHMSRYHHERTITWLKPWVGYGFPLPKGARRTNR